MTTQTDLFTQVRAMFLLLVTCEVVRGQDNRVPMPLGAFVAITPGKGSPLSTVLQTYDPTGQTVTIGQPTEYRIAVDCYGPGSNENARALCMALRSTWGCDQLSGLQPLYAGDAVQFPLVDGEQQYEERWRFEAVLQYGPSITLAQQSALSAKIGLVDVDAIYYP